MSSESSDTYFLRCGPSSYRATQNTSGAWNEGDQHIAPSLGLLTHLMENDVAARRRDALTLTRVSFDIYGTMPIAEMDYEVNVLRPGRTIELVEANLMCQGKQIVRARAWFLSAGDTHEFAGSAFEPIPPPQDHEEWVPANAWQGGALAALQCRRLLHAPGQGTFWLSTSLALIDDAPTSALANAVGLFDFANGMVARANPAEVVFPNVELTAHLLRDPVDGPIGFDTRVSFSEGGVGLTHSVIHDEAGPLGSVAQSLTVRPLRSYSS